MHVPTESNPDLSAKFTENIFSNAQSSLPNLDTLNDFETCLACLYYAKATLDDNFMQNDPTCSGCYTDYCWQG